MIDAPRTVRRPLAGPTWIFDLDNTLHDADPHIFPHLNRSMTAYLETHLGLGARRCQLGAHAVLATLRSDAARADPAP